MIFITLVYWILGDEAHGGYLYARETKNLVAVKFTRLDISFVSDCHKKPGRVQKNTCFSVNFGL